MRLPGRFVLILALAVLAPASAFAQAPAKKPIDVYKEYQAAVKTAKTITPILPFLTKEYADNLKGAPKDMQDRMLTRFAEHGGYKDIVVTKETPKGDMVELEATAKGTDGKPLTGKIAFKNEGGAWKIEGQGWVPDFGKKE